MRRAACAAAAMGLPLDAQQQAIRPLPDEALFRRDPEAYWLKVREDQFYLPGWRSFLNNGSLGVAPRPVLAAVFDYLTRSAALMLEEYPRWGYEPLDEQRQELADFFGCKKDELAIMHNATAALCTIANGLDLQAGDEVLLTDQEHPSGRGCWYQKQARFGSRVREVPIPLPPKSADQLADVMISAIGPRTRVIGFSGITTTSGLIMPVRRICDAARAKGILSVVDGAHMNGQIPFRLSDLGCDFFAGSPHKWMFTPAGCGMMYVREEMLDRLWNNVMSGSWNDRDMKAARFMNIGTNNRAVIEGMMAGLRFLKQLGPDRVYARIHSLSRLAYKLACELPGARVLSSDDHRLYGGLIGFNLHTPAWPAIHEVLKQKRVWHIAAEHTRLSTHIHTRPRDIEEFFSIVRDGLKRV